MLKNKWFTFAVIAFLIYAYAKERFNSPKYESAPIINPGNYPEIAKSSNIRQKEVDDEKLATKTLYKTSKSPVGNFQLEENAGILQQKIVNFANQIINGPIGQKITEGILTAAPGDQSKSDYKPLPYYNLTKNDLIKGEGEQVKCGQKVKAHIIVKLSDGTTYLNTHLSKKPITFTIGQGEVIRGLEYNVINMDKEGYRKVFIPPSQAYDNPKFVTSKIGEGEFINLEIELLDFSPLMDKKLENIIIKDSQLKNMQDIYRCGDKAKFLYKIKDEKTGAILYQTERKKPAIGKIGDKNFPYILTWALEAMPLESKKTILFSSELLKNIDNETTNFFSPINLLPSNLILELETLNYK